MNIFDILGPIMIGPSSSHTAGVVRIGNIARRILGATPNKAIVQFHGSLAKTYKGHGSDKAIIAGLLGFPPDDVRIRDSLGLSPDLDYKIEVVELENAHPNTVLLELFSEKLQKTLKMQAASVGGGNILVQKINEIDVLFDGYHDTLVIIHKDKPGAVSLVSNVLAVEKINIAEMKMYRSKKGGQAIMIIELDEQVDKSLATTLSALPLMTKVTLLSGMAG
ncbi:MAG: L-serine ammonia-lyase, iron-sulfur-dependent subunit beta [Defluviitaleaceae bacterium]|nr:L-serine ammonia-lyase, iron-sulfur-dependent subunit beta [Defluviitaleaceae bacterium]